MWHNLLVCEAWTGSYTRQKDSEVTITVLDDGKVRVDFHQEERAITPGQAVVFYQDEVCLGGGTIETVLKNEEQLKYVG